MKNLLIKIAIWFLFPVTSFCYLDKMQCYTNVKGEFYKFSFFDGKKASVQKYMFDSLYTFEYSVYVSDSTYFTTNFNFYFSDSVLKWNTFINKNSREKKDTFNFALLEYKDNGIVKIKNESFRCVSDFYQAEKLNPSPLGTAQRMGGRGNRIENKGIKNNPVFENVNLLGRFRLKDF